MKLLAAGAIALGLLWLNLMLHRAHNDETRRVK